jgi:hypothetical protein
MVHLVLNRTDYPSSAATAMHS